MTEEALIILQTAVTLAKNEQIRRLARLKTRLLEYYPKSPAAIEEALKAWSEYVRNKGDTALED